MGGGHLSPALPKLLLFLGLFRLPTEYNNTFDVILTVHRR